MHFGSKRVDPKIKVLTSVGEPVPFFTGLSSQLFLTVVDPSLYSRELFLGGLPAPAPYIFYRLQLRLPLKRLPALFEPCKLQDKIIIRILLNTMCRKTV